MSEQIIAIRRVGYKHRYLNRRPSKKVTKIPVCLSILVAKHFASIEEARAEIAWLVENGYRSNVWEIISASIERVEERSRFGDGIINQVKWLDITIHPAIEVAS